MAEFAVSQIHLSYSTLFTGSLADAVTAAILTCAMVRWTANWSTPQSDVYGVDVARDSLQRWYSAHRESAVAQAYIQMV